MNNSGLILNRWHSYKEHDKHLYECTYCSISDLLIFFEFLGLFSEKVSTVCFSRSCFDFNRRYEVFHYSDNLRRDANEDSEDF